MKRVMLFLAAIVMCVATGFAQDKVKHWEMEVGGGLNFAQGKAITSDHKIGRSLFVEARYLFANQRMYVGLLLNQSQFDRKMWCASDGFMTSGEKTFSNASLQLTYGCRVPLAKKG